MRFAARVDVNQPSIVAILKQLGCSVQDLSAVGQGCPDLLVGVGGTNLLLEIKDGAKSLSRRDLTPAQKLWHASWTGKVHTVKSIEEVLDLVAYYRGRLRRP
jgi:hypothetical protein